MRQKLEGGNKERTTPGALLPILLTLLAALGPVSTDVYLPSLPGIAADLETSASFAQLTIGLFFAGFAVMMLICGPLADRFGRRPVILAGLVIYVLASIVCLLSTSIGMLLVARFVQAIGASVGPVAGRAVVRDLYGPKESGRIFGYMSSAMALGPMLGPFIGGYLETAFGWRANFWFIGSYGFCLLIVLAWNLPETRPKASSALRVVNILDGYRLLLGHRRFKGFMLTVALASAALFTWIGNAAFVVIDHFGIAPSSFGFVFGIVVAGYIIGAYGGSHLGLRLGAAQTTGLGAAIAALAGMGLLLSGWSGFGDLYAITVLMTLSFLGTGIVIPQGTAGGLAPFPERAGSAAALVGFAQMSGGFLVILISSVIYDGTPRTMVTLNAIASALALFVWLRFVRRS